MPRLFLALSLGCVLIAGATAGDQPNPKQTAFKVTVQSNLNMNLGQNLDIVAETEFRYTWKQDKQVRTLQVDLAQVKSTAGGQEQINARMTRTSFTDFSGGTTKEVKAEDGPPQLKRLLTDSFGSPLCKLEVDATGKELKRTIVAGPGAKQLIDSGMIANTTLFHPWYATDQDEWEAPMEISAGFTIVSGKVKYTKIPGGKGSQATKVAGTLPLDGVKGPGGLLIKNGKYTVTGEQTYDPTRGEWIDGKLTMEVSFKLHEGDKPIGSASGTMNLKFELLPDKK